MIFLDSEDETVYASAFCLCSNREEEHQCPAAIEHFVVFRSIIVYSLNPKGFVSLGRISSFYASC